MVSKYVAFLQLRVMVGVWMKMMKMNLKCTETEKNDERLNYAVK